MKKYIILIICVWSISSAFAQKNEYRYPAIRFGFSNGFSGQPQFNANKYLYAPSYTTTEYEQMQLSPISSFSGYTPGFMASFLYHFDFSNEKSGVFTGLDYNLNGISSKYETTDNFGGRQFYLTETHRMHMVGVPVAFRYGPDLWDTQTYVYAGVRFNYIVAISSVQNVNWVSAPSSIKLEKEEYNATTFSFFFGANWKFINLQVDFYPSSVFDQTFIQDPEVNSYRKYEGQVDKFFTITTSVNIPYGWLSEQSFWWKRKLRKIPFWK